MFQVYTAKDKSELSKNLIGEFKDYDDAMDCAEKQSKVNLTLDTLLKKQMVVLIVMVN